MDIIRVDSVSKIFRAGAKSILDRGKEFVVLENISFSLPKGVSLSITGPNGAGKTTMLKILAGILKPDKGKVEVKGKVIPIIDIASLLIEDLSGLENIYYYGSLLGMERDFITKNLKKILEFSELEDFMHLKVKKYSSGMAARLAFSVATVSMPDILLIDETQSVGDRMFRQKSFNRIDSMKKRGATIVYVTHSNDEILSFADKALYLKNGRSEMYGSPRAVTLHYIEDIESKTKRKLSESIAKFYSSLKGSGADEQAEGLRVELLEKISLLKFILFNDMNLLDRMLETNTGDFESERQKMLKIIRELTDALDLELEISGEGKDITYRKLADLKRKEMTLSGALDKNFMTYESLKLPIEKLGEIKNKFIKLSLMDSLDGLRNLSKLSGLEIEKEKELIIKYESFFLHDSVLEFREKLPEYLKFIMIISAFNARLDRAFLSERMGIFLDFFQKLTNGSIDEYGREIACSEEILNFSNENFIFQMASLIEGLAGFKPSSEEIVTYLRKASAMTLTSLDERLIKLSQESLEPDGKKIRETLNSCREIRARVCSVILSLKPQKNGTARDIRIEEVQTLDEDGERKKAFMPQEFLRLRIFYDAITQVKRPVFGVAIYTDSGVLLTGPNTMNSGHKISSVKGKGHVDYSIPKLPFLSGHYLVTVSVHAEDSYAPYDLVDKLHSFEIVSDDTRYFGKVHINAEWEIH